MFTEADLTAALTRIGSKLRRKTSVYLIGGCAMTFMGRKVATKDIDVVFSSAEEAKDFMSALRSTGFDSILEPANEYDALGATAIMEDNRHMRFDIFDRQVCSALAQQQYEITRTTLSKLRQFGRILNVCRRHLSVQRNY